MSYTYYYGHCLKALADIINCWFETQNKVIAYLFGVALPFLTWQPSRLSIHESHDDNTKCGLIQWIFTTAYLVEFYSLFYTAMIGIDTE